MMTTVYVLTEHQADLVETFVLERIDGASQKRTKVLRDILKSRSKLDVRLYSRNKVMKFLDFLSSWC